LIKIATKMNEAEIINFEKWVERELGAETGMF
jgi:hypothetical protein